MEIRPELRAKTNILRHAVSGRTLVNMITTKAYGVSKAKEPVGSLTISRREVGPSDVLIEIQYCGICHSDIHQARDEWGGGIFPMVPGHEIVGEVTSVGSAVTRFNVGDPVGVGCLVDSCRTCRSCKDSLEQYCENGWVGTYNGLERDGKTPTYGGYSERIVVDENFVLKLPRNLDRAATAPLLCAGITTYSPLRQFRVGPGQRVGIVGLGGLGHMGLKLAVAMGAETVLFTSSPGKKAAALALGASDVVVSRDADAMAKQAGRFDFILDTVSANHDINALLGALRRDGTLCLVGAPEHPHQLSAFGLIMARRRIAGSLIGGIAETQEMLDFCGQHNIVSDIELTTVSEINRAYERIVASDVKYRFVIDMQSLRSS